MNIYGAISAIMNDIGAIGKTSKNQQQGFMYRGIDAVMNALNPAFIKHKVFVVPEVQEMTREERTTKSGTALIYTMVRVRYTFFAEDGSNVQAVVIGEGMDSGDKSCNKAMSIAYKYACFQVFCIPTEEFKDPDGESYEVAPVERYMVDENKVAVLVAKLNEKNIPIDKVLERYKVKSLAEMTVQQWTNAINSVDKTK